MSGSFETPWTAACQSPLSMKFPGKNTGWSLPFPPSGRDRTCIFCAERGFFAAEPPGKPFKALLAWLVWVGSFGSTTQRGMEVCDDKWLASQLSQLCVSKDTNLGARDSGGIWAIKHAVWAQTFLDCDRILGEQVHVEITARGAL